MHLQDLRVCPAALRALCRSLGAAVIGVLCSGCIVITGSGADPEPCHTIESGVDRQLTPLTIVYEVHGTIIPVLKLPIVALVEGQPPREDDHAALRSIITNSPPWRKLEADADGGRPTLFYVVHAMTEGLPPTVDRWIVANGRPVVVALGAREDLGPPRLLYGVEWWKTPIVLGYGQRLIRTGDLGTWANELRVLDEWPTGWDGKSDLHVPCRSIKLPEPMTLGEIRRHRPWTGKPG